MSFWERVEKDLQKEIRAGIAFLKQSTAVVRKKAEELSEDGKRRQAIFQLKTDVRHEIAELGGRVYDLITTQDFPIQDKRVKAIAARIRKLETQLAKLEGKGTAKAGGTGKKTPAKKPVRKKNT
jgi:hypothetical protein